MTQGLCAGVNVLAEDNVPSFILVNAIFLLGTFTFAVVLGVVSDDIGNELKVRFTGPCHGYLALAGTISSHAAKLTVALSH